MGNQDDSRRYMGPGLLRAVRAEARLSERALVIETLEQAWIAANGEAQRTRSKNPALTRPGRRAASMQEAMDVLRAAGRTTYADDVAGEPFAYITAACDSVELYEYDPDPNPGEDLDEESMPVRLVVADGADSTLASAYLGLDEAEQAFRDGLRLVDVIRRRRAERAEADVPEQAEEGTNA